MNISSRVSVASLQEHHAVCLAISCLVNACLGKLLPSSSPVDVRSML